MSRHIMISTIFEKNRLERLLKPINGKLVPSFMIETRQELDLPTGYATSCKQATSKSKKESTLMRR
jgi:hypothetical protein